MPPPLSSLQKFFGSPRVQKFYPVLFPLTLFFLILIAPVPRSASILASSSASSAAEIIPGAATEAAATSDSGVSALAVSEKTPPPTAHDPYNVYFLKIPKVGGTTLAVLLQRYAKQFQLQVASPLAATRSVASCQGRDGALKAWNELRARSPGGRFDIMMSHGCFKPFMTKLEESWNKPRRLLRLTMFREPWSRVVSFYRFVSKCCEQDPPLPWCALQCGWAKTPEKFMAHNCIELSNCNQLYYYLRAQYPDAGLVLAQADADKMLDDFDLVLTLENLDEGLVLLHLEYGVPFELLPHINANANTRKPPKISDKARQASLGRMQPDVMLYDAAASRLRQRIARVSSPALFEDKLALLRAVQQRVKESCQDRFGECLTSDPGVVSEGSCYFECVEAVTRDAPAPPVPYCKECAKFAKGCFTCECKPDGGAACEARPGNCQSLAISHKCLGA